MSVGRFVEGAAEWIQETSESNTRLFLPTSGRSFL
jgi:hypothetical protein